MPKKSRQSRKMKRMHVPGVPGALAFGASGGRRRRQRGGSEGAPAPPASAPYSDAASYVGANYGDGNTQWNNVFGPQSTSTMGNEIVNLNHHKWYKQMCHKVVEEDAVELARENAVVSSEMLYPKQSSHLDYLHYKTSIQDV